MESPLRTPEQRRRTTPRSYRNPHTAASATLPAPPASPLRGRTRETGNDGRGLSSITGLSVELGSISPDPIRGNNDEVSLKQWTTNLMSGGLQHIEWSYQDLSSLVTDSTDTPIHERSALLGKVIANTRFRIDVVLDGQHSAQALWRATFEDRPRIPGASDVCPSVVEESEAHFSVYIAPTAGGQEDYKKTRDVFPQDANIFLGIKHRDEAVGRRHAYHDWVWQTSVNYVFTDDFSFCEIQLPSIRVLLENPRIREQDAFTLVMRLQAPASHALNFNTGKQLVDRSLMLGLKSLLDDAKTGDVKFVCLEKQEYSSLSASSPERPTPRRNRYRKRILFAHSGILKHRSEYLDDCIKFSSEREQVSAAKRNFTTALDRAVHTIQCFDVDYVTMYWLLHYIYTGEVDFKEERDFRDSMDLRAYTFNTGFTRRFDSDRGDENEWEWSDADPLHEGQSGWNTEDDDNATVKSAITSRSSASTSSHQRSRFPAAAPAPFNKSNISVRAGTDERTTSTTPNSGSRASRSSAGPSNTTSHQQASLGRKISSPNPPVHQAFICPLPVPDPHEHPVGQVSPASAFATYSLAHRYQLDDLACLARDHLLACLTPHGACSLLMASFRFQDLHSLVEDYVISHWEAVQASVIQEVANGS
ncbi:hypothetical protein QFC19_004482 [Naganishia cerealis]|uniref:Uncharacterized protein n=1 Tax=Naganishia cerealis TaxID=610337 RepID=A0ACC2VW56_9TREE|nr:hypothetical protein QFC19_004482 [Naganishia cerealis]